MNDINKIKNKTEFINALKQNFATTVKKIYINSLNAEVGFREIKVSEQKILSRIMIDNENRKDVIYDAQCAMINQVKLNDDFSIYDALEFDKIKLMIALYQADMYKNEIKFQCKHCGTENVYKLDFSNVLKKLDDIDISDKNYTFDGENWKFDFVVGYPTVRKVSEFYKNEAKNFRNMSKKEIQTANNLGNMDYLTTFIKKIHIFNKQNNFEQDIDMSEFTASETSEIFQSFPQDVLYVDDGVISFIINNYIKNINESFDKHKCLQCGEEYEEAPDTSTESFL